MHLVIQCKNFIMFAYVLKYIQQLKYTVFINDFVLALLLFNSFVTRKYHTKDVVISNLFSNAQWKIFVGIVIFEILSKLWFKNVHLWVPCCTRQFCKFVIFLHFLKEQNTYYYYTTNVLTAYHRWASTVLLSGTLIWLTFNYNTSYTMHIMFNFLMMNLTYISRMYFNSIILWNVLVTSCFVGLTICCMCAFLLIWFIHLR